MQDNYHPTKMIVSAAGKINHEKFVEQITNSMVKLPQGKIKERIKASYKGGEYREDKELEQIHLILGFNGIDYYDDDYYALKIYSAILAISFFSIIICMSGVVLILGSSLSVQSSEQFVGNIVAFLTPISFVILVIIIRKSPNVDMVPAQFIAGVFSAIIGYFIVGKLSISPYDLFLASMAGFFQIGFGFILITIGSQTTPSAVVGVLMLTESVFGPLWAWLFINEIPPFTVLIGGGGIIFSILLQSFYGKKN